MADEQQKPEGGLFRDWLESEIAGEDADDGVGTQWWFNTRTGEVEEGPQSLGVDRVGPFKSRDEAARANEIIAERARKWADEDD